MSNVTPVVIQPAKHRNLNWVGQTCLWSGMDSEKYFEDNCKNAERFNKLQELNWLDPGIITYKFNQYGFRADELDTRAAGLALGCSFTEGVGIKLEQTWPSQLSQLCNMPVWNLGVGGTSIDTVFRLLDHYLPVLNIKFVCILLPPASRFEYFNDYNEFEYITPYTLDKYPDFSKMWLSQTVNADLNVKKNILAIKQICHSASIPLTIIDSQLPLLGREPFDRKQDLARDLSHPGPLYNKAVAEFAYKEIQLVFES